MTDRPILFHDWEILALLGGRKTQTRRVIKPHRHASLFDGSWADSYVLDPGNAEWREREIKFRVGDRLWVKETFIAGHGVGGYADGVDPDADPNGETVDIIYRSDFTGSAGPWSSPIFMPRWASRLTLVVTDVRVQRLQEISEEDAKAEGAYLGRAPNSVLWTFDGKRGRAIPQDAFRDLWGSLNAKRGYGWDTNPWVCALTFEVHRSNIDAMKEAA